MRERALDRVFSDLRDHPGTYPVRTAYLDPRDTASADLLAVCPVCGMDLHEADDVVTWFGWPSHRDCLEWAQAGDRFTQRPCAFHEGMVTSGEPGYVLTCGRLACEGCVRKFIRRGWFDNPSGGMAIDAGFLDPAWRVPGPQWSTVRRDPG